jgi:hypothetical protein
MQDTQTTTVKADFCNIILPLWNDSHLVGLTTAKFTILMLPVKVKVTLWLAVYSQPVRLGVRPLETHDQRFFQLNSCGNSPYVTSSLTRRWVCLLRMCLAFRQAYISYDRNGPHYSTGKDSIENTASSSSSIIAWHVNRLFPRDGPCGWRPWANNSSLC